MTTNKLIGGILLVSGTTLGAGLLGLPAVCGFMGLYASLVVFFITWAVMLAAGMFFVEITCKLKNNANMITMAQKTAGQWAMVVSWVTYLLLLYSLIALYISGSSPIFSDIYEALFQAKLSPVVANFCLPVFFGWIIYLGPKSVDFMNRYFMIGLCLSYLLLVSLLPNHINTANYAHFDAIPALYALPVIITGFGYHIVIPTLGSYMDYDKKMMKKSIVVGSVISLLFNALWLFLIIGVLPLSSLVGIEREGVSITHQLAYIISSPSLIAGVYGFSFFAILTSFLGVGISLSDFLVDGLKITQCWKGKMIAISLTFIPPLLFVTSYQRGFILALQYAGMFVAILLAFIPSAMILSIKHKFYQSPLGKSIAITVMGFSLLVIISNLMIRWGFFDAILQGYTGVN